MRLSRLYRYVIIGLGSVFLTGCPGQSVATDMNTEPDMGAPTTKSTFVAGYPTFLNSSVDSLETSPEVSFNYIWGVVADSAAGVLYIGDGPTIRRYQIGSGVLTTIVGQAGRPDYVNGFGTAARLGSESSGLVLTRGALYSAEDGDTTGAALPGSCAIRKIDLASMNVSTLAGPLPSDPVPSCGFVDGPASTARFTFRNQGSTLTTDGAFLYAADSNNHALRKVSLTDGTTTTIAGGPPPTPAGGLVNAMGTAARFYYPFSIFYLAATNSLIVSDGCNQVVRGIDLSSLATSTLAGAGTAGLLDGVGTAAMFGACSLRGGGLDPAGPTIYFGDTKIAALRRFNLGTKAVTTVAGAYPMPTSGFQDGTGTAALLEYPNGAMAIVGNALYFADNSISLRRMDLTTQVVKTIAGARPGYNDSRDGVGTNARFSLSSAIVPDGNGSAYALDWSAIRKIDLSTWTVTTVAGTLGTTGYADGVGMAAQMKSPSSGVMHGGVLYFSDYGNCAIRKFDPATGKVTTVAGSPPASGVSCGLMNGMGTTARWTEPSGLCKLGNTLYISEQADIRAMDLTTFQVTTLAGNGTMGFADGPAAAARFWYPSAPVAGSDGKLYVADPSNVAIRQIDPATGAVTTVAGALPPFARAGYQDAVGAAARFGSPLFITSDPTTGLLYINDYGTLTVRTFDTKTLQVSTVYQNPYGGMTWTLFLPSRSKFPLLGNSASIIQMNF